MGVTGSLKAESSSNRSVSGRDLKQQPPGVLIDVSHVFENPSSLDSSIQSALSVLFPPFEATAPTVISQLFQVIEKRYRGDALQCLLNFLIPAKHILESVQQAACAPYSDVVFRCEGWPLCLHDRVVVQLAPINPLLLSPGDFYLQVTPINNQAARIVVRSLLEEERLRVEETPVPESSYPSIFTEDWLKDLNHGRHGSALSQCLLATEQGIVKVPWAQVFNPEFLVPPSSMASSPISLQVDNSEGTSLQSPCVPPAYSVETRILPAKDGIAVSVRLVEKSSPRKGEEDQDSSVTKPVGWLSPNTWDNHQHHFPEGDYVDLVEFSKEKEAHGRPWGRPRPSILRSNSIVASGAPAAPKDRTPCLRTVRFAEEPCTPCMRRKLGHGTKGQELKCRYRESYLEAQQDPVCFERGRYQDLQQGSVPSDKVVGITSELPDVPRAPPCCYPSEEPCQGPRAGQASHEDLRDVQSGPQRHPQDLKATNEGGSTSPNSAVVGTSEKCHIVIQGQESLENRNSYLEMIPRLHVVQGKRTTAFGLVSPKLDRRRHPSQGGHQEKKLFPPINGLQIDSQRPSEQSARGIQEDKEKPRPRAPSPPQATSTSTHLLQSGLACLSGGRDRGDRAVVEIYGDHEAWSSPQVSSLELSKLLLYFLTITRREARELGMTLVFDARKKLPRSAFNQALLVAQEQASCAIHAVLVLVNKETSHTLEKCSALTVDIVTSLKALHKTVEGSQLTHALDGTFPYSHTDWLELHQKLHPFVSDLQEASALLNEAIERLEGVHKIDTVQDVQHCINKQRTLMKDVLEDTRLVALQREGGAMLSRLNRESDLRYLHCASSRDAMAAVTNLYNQLEEQVHVLARRSNMSLQHLDFLMMLREKESRFTEIKRWFDAEGETRLLEAESVEDSSEKIAQTLHNFTTFLSEANEKKRQAMILVAEAEGIQGPPYSETEVFRTMVCTFKSNLAHFLSRAEQCCEELEAMADLCHFCEKATELAKDCREYLVMEQSHGQPEMQKLTFLKGFQECFSEFSLECFQEMKVQASRLRGSRGMRVWNVAWFKCQEVRHQLEERLQDLEQSHRAVLPPGTPCYVAKGNLTESEPAPVDRLPEPQSERPHPDHAEDWYGTLGERNCSSVTCFNIKFKPDNGARKRSRGATKHNHAPDRDAKVDGGVMKKGTCQEQPAVGGSGGCDWSPSEHRPSESMSQGTSVTSGCPEVQAQGLTPSHRHPSHQVQEVAPRFQMSRHGSFCSQGVSCETESGSKPVPVVSLPIWRDGGLQSLYRPESQTNKNMKLQRIMDELLLTEVEYVRSLCYTLTHYLPLLARPDVPQELRGQRGTIFGNLEALYEFHCHYFLRELEACQEDPLGVGRCFLRHEESFGLYALYSKNKPQSDALVLNPRHDFFKRKQLELSDCMDLSSYLLRPVQRISKYSLLLQDMLAECWPHQASQREEIQAAVEVVRFQLRHGNDLLTMDAIQGCDVNLKEQGQLIRQDEFCVFFRKKKSLRRIFLFQDLILFSKPKKTDRGDDVFAYKQSFKMSDVGLTHNSGKSGLCFEIWFRRRKSQDTYTLQAERRDVKEAWARDLQHLLWEQAVHSRELRMQERVFMGMGAERFMDIQPSDAAICNRAVNCSPPGKESKALPAPVISSPHRDLAMPRPDSIGSDSNASTSGSHSSSSSGRGSLPLIGCPANQACGVLTEDGHQSQCPHVLCDGAGLAGARGAGLRGSDSVCSGAEEGKQGGSSLVSPQNPSTGGHQLSAEPAQHRGPHAVSRTKPSIAPKPLLPLKTLYKVSGN